MASKKLTDARLKEIHRRQDPPQWGHLYEPGIKATREEAPSISRPTQLWSHLLQRVVHALSSVEVRAIILALFHPNLFELHEQRMLSVEPRPHPLASHPRAAGLNLPPLAGTIAVAERLDLLNEHRWIKYRDRKTGEDAIVPFPFFGDLLLFLSDSGGPYCINWTIKKTEEDFSRSPSLRHRIRYPEMDAAAAKARHAIEEQYHLDAGIRTVRVVENAIPDTLAHNLRNLFLYQRSCPALRADIWHELEDRLRASLTTGESPQSVLLSMVHRHGIEYDDMRPAFFITLWRRRVRVELFEEPIFVDRPLKPERNDPLKHFGSWFSREDR